MRACQETRIEKLSDPSVILNAKNHILPEQKLSIEDNSVFFSRLQIARQAACGWKMT
jgi:hypothetical protein